MNVLYPILFLLSLLACPVAAQPTVRVRSGHPLVVDGRLSVFTDTTRQLTLAQVRGLYGQHRFRPLPGHRLLRNYTTANYWLHLRFNPAPARLIHLEIDNPRLDQVRFYQLTDHRLVDQIITGDTRPFHSRGYPDYNWIFPIMPDPHRPTDVFVMVSKYTEVLSAQLRVWGPNAFEQHDRQRYLLWGGLAGLTLLVLLLNGMVWIATANSLYGWFMAVIVAHAFHLSAASGLSFQFLWPGHPIVNDWYPQTLSAWLVVLTQVHFMQLFIGQTARNSRVFRYVNGFKFTIIAAILLTVGLLVLRAVPSFYFRLLVGLTLLFSLLVLPIAVLSLYERIRRREAIIRFYAGVTSLQFLSLLLYFASLALVQTGSDAFVFTNEGMVIVNFLIVLVILSLGVLYFGFTSYRRQNEQLLTTLHRQEQAQAGRIIEALEIERGRIAEDLYDDVGAMLSTAIGYVSGVLRKPDVREQYPLLTEVRRLLDRAVENLRTVSHNLMPKNFAELGLARSLAETVDKVAVSTSIQFHYVVAGAERRLGADVEVQIFRIAVELINDIVRNSGATQATLQLIYGADQLLLLSEDNGPLPPEYNNLHSKVAFINGTLDADVTPSGVTVTVEIPYERPLPDQHQPARNHEENPDCR